MNSRRPANEKAVCERIRFYRLRMDRFDFGRRFSSRDRVRVMENVHDHPAVAMALETGYPEARRIDRCCDCGAEASEYLAANDSFYCRRCAGRKAREWFCSLALDEQLDRAGFGVI